jgi:glycosyltransferase involved in cell wall biosynthesis
MERRDDSALLVSICCTTYNHEKFIEQCLKGFVMQQTNFRFEVLIHEDASTDKTSSIVREYEIKYPHLFRCVYQTENQFLKQNTLLNILFPMSGGKYIALCEGDDYWTDPHKLQRQVDILEKNRDYAVCFHNTEEKDETTVRSPFYYCSEAQREISSTEDLLLEQNFIPTCSVVFRNNLFSKFPDFIYKLAIGDWIIHILNSQFGKIYYINDVMAVHRLHSNGIWSQNASIKNQLHILSAYDALGSYFKSNQGYRKIIKGERIKLLNSIFSHYFNAKEKKEALRYLHRLIKLDPGTLFQSRKIKELIKIVVA